MGNRNDQGKSIHAQRVKRRKEKNSNKGVDPHAPPCKPIMRGSGRGRYAYFPGQHRTDTGAYR